MNRHTIGFSIHRPEVVSITADFMGRHETIFLEEPPVPQFAQMLRGTLAIDDYLMAVDFEYPEFSRSMCRVLRDLHQKGKKIIQEEPYLQKLLAIHAFFAQGHRPAELKPYSVLHRVYLAERDATQALLDYYSTVMNGTFEAAIDAVNRFARRDAARFRLRDSMRARALAARIIASPSAYVEAGSIHFYLYGLLRKALPNQVDVRPVFLGHQALKMLGGKGHLFGPGDRLTLHYIFHPHTGETRREALLAARSLIYTKLIEKEELSAGPDTFPHVRDEVACVRTVAQLSLGDCARLFPLIRRIKSADARQIVYDYVVRFKKKFRQETVKPGSEWPCKGGVS